jgi:hypothetical protein
MTLANKTAKDTPCQGGCGKVRSILCSDSPTDWLCNDCRTKTASRVGRSKLAKLNKLMKSAEHSAVYRGHALGPWTITKYFEDQWCARAECSCGAQAYVNTKPLPNEIDIGGQAVAVNHPALILPIGRV